MTNAELIAKIKAEIERRIKECEATYPKDKGEYWFPEQEEAYAIAGEYKQLLSFLGTLEDDASEKPNNHMEIVNDLTSEVPTRAVQLPDGRWVTEKLAHQIDINFMAEVKQYYSDNFDLINGDNPTLNIVTHIARHFFELGMSVK